MPPQATGPPRCSSSTWALIGASSHSIRQAAAGPISPPAPQLLRRRIIEGAAPDARTFFGTVE